MESSVEEFFYYLMLKHYFAFSQWRSRINELFDMLPGIHTVSVLFLLVRNLKLASHNPGVCSKILWSEQSHLIIRYEAISCESSQLWPIIDSPT